MGKQPSRRGANSRGAHVTVGGVLYIRARNTRLLDRPSADAKVLAVLQPQAQVVWLGPDEQDRRWQKVRYGTLTGVLMAANLSIKKPDLQIHAVLPTLKCRACNGSGRLVPVGSLDGP